MAALTKLFAMLLAIINMFLVNIGIKKIENSEIQDNSGEVVITDKSESNLCETAEYAVNAANSVQCVYTDSKRSAYKMTNKQINLTHSLTNSVKSCTLTDKNGNVYASNFRSFYSVVPGTRCYFETSVTDARVNTIRLGEYYYDCHIRDLESPLFKVDKNFHIYADKMYMQYTLLCKKATKALYAFGSETDIPASSVNSIQIKDKNGVHNSIIGIDTESVEYIAFDIKDTGIIGFITPADGSTEKVSVSLGVGVYTVTHIASYEPYTGINNNEEEGGYELNNVTFGCRVYTDSTHSFDGIEKAAFEERNPLDNITVSSGTSNAVYLGYDALSGMYELQMDGVDFQTAYDNPYLRYTAPISITSNDDRVIYVRSAGKCGCLEAAVLLDENNTLAPVDVQVCKNFQGDGGEGFYSLIDYQYGDAIFPVKLNKNEKLSFTLVDLYQNWGKYPLKQLSSIEFHVSYYHLSTGTTESNCIAPYFVYEKDGWTLPDFRNRSGNIWETQPQFNSVGILKFMSYRTDYSDDTYYSEFAGSIINSCGPTYADITDTYTDDMGKYTYSLRHIEMPQTDENRTYYSLKVTFNEDVTYDNFRDNFDLFYFDGRYVKFNKATYLNSDNIPVSVYVDTSDTVEYYKLGTTGAYLGYYNVTEETQHYLDDMHFGCNFGLLIKNTKIISCGEEINIPYVFREASDDELTMGALTLDADTLTFKKGDTIEIDMVLLPWGTGKEENAKNLITVREDSILNPVEITSVVKGSVQSDTYVPTVRAENGEAEFSVKGGRNNITLVINGFNSLKVPDIFIKQNGQWVKYEIASDCGYDGYGVKLLEDGTYSFSFVYTAENPYETYSFKVIQ